MRSQMVQRAYRRSIKKITRSRLRILKKLRSLRKMITHMLIQRVKRPIRKWRKELRKSLTTFHNKLIKRSRKLSRDTRKNIICISIVGVILLGLAINVWYKNRPAPDTNYSVKLSESTAIESHFLAVGDIYWGRRMHDWSQQSSLKEAYPFSKLDSLQRDSYDAWIGNLECPAVPDKKQPVGFDVKLWNFNCDTSYLPEAAKWFDIVSLANNHTQNQNREVGLEATRSELEKVGIQYFGNFNPHIRQDVCEVVSLPARATINGRLTSVKVPVAMCGFGGVYHTVTDKSIATMRAYAQVMPVIAYPHMGQEYQPAPDEYRRQLYRKMIDNGADMVLGNHPHWVQSTEAYKGKLIVYSMGNFIFDQQFSMEVTRSAAIDVVMSAPKSEVAQRDLAAWTAIGETCKSFKDTCLTQIQQNNLQRLPFRLTYNIVGIDTSNQITRRANMRIYNEVIDRLNWDETKQAL